MEDINMSYVFDEDRLRRSNQLLVKWLPRFGYVAKEHQRFCAKLQKDHKQMASLLPQNMRSQFAKDCKVMFYAAEVDNSVVQQFIPMVHKILRKMPISEDQYDDHFVEGLMAIRAAVWHFRPHKANAKFATFCHNSISKKINWFRMKAHSKIKRRESKCKVVFANDMASKAAYSHNFDDYVEEPMKDLIDRLITACNLSEPERFLIKSFVERDQRKDGVWFDEYRKIYNKKSRQTISIRLKKVQLKIFREMRRRKMISEDFFFTKYF
jgi:hypothetical protein